MTVLVLLLAAGFAGGLVVVATAVVPAWRPGPDATTDRWRRRWRRTPSVTERRVRDWRRGRRALIAGGSGLLILLYLRIPAAAMLVAALAWLTPTLLSGAAEAEASIARLEALADWTRRIADLMSSGAGLEQAMEASLGSCPPPIAAEVGALVARLTARWTAADALRAFADDLVDADEVVGALILAADVARGAGLRQALIALAESTEARVRARREVEADRAKPRAGARTVMIIIGVSVAAVMLLGRQFLLPYRSLTGEIVLIVDGALFLAALWWMRTLSRTPPEPRLLPPSSGPAAAQRVGDSPQTGSVASGVPARGEETA
ncbi:type II secretion system F family protein [Frankia sp. AgKG'84/4]|uniref:type II secretion system F family protein n=1 Tax=Frankia sp. AgKG'84/4 TaxID=573490 RepID=UPI00200C5EF4|nr:type II secretion system F family protein [Frankia sp. AgKG'84/4]MCL9793868.1 type II secretion system F family protein [Frankia sp. AgKG'84/4]